MPTIRLALAQVNPIVGDLHGNSELALSAVKSARDSGAQIVALPEMLITSYPVEDLALRPSFQIASENQVHELAKTLAANDLGEVVVVVGFLKGTSSTDSTALGVPRGAPMNCAAVIHRGKVVAEYAKHHLPNYGVFDEARYFVPGNETVVIRAFGAEIALAICEDIWQDGQHMKNIRKTGASLLLVLNGSPYERDKDDVRRDLVSARARECNMHLAYVNMVGGQDELVFEGDSIVVDPSGNVIARAKQFESDLLITDLHLPDVNPNQASLGDFSLVELITEPVVESAPISVLATERLDRNAEMYRALVVGLRDYVNKNGFTSVLIGLSGGIDSAVVAAIAVDALGAQRVFGVAMPSEYSSEHSVADAQDIADRTGLNFRITPIKPMVKTFLAELGFTGVAEENLQARIRGTTLMGISNQEGHLVLATGNKSELAVGYSTIYGDAVGGYAPIKDLFKTDVWEIAKWRNGVALAQGATPPIPENSITKPPSAELRPGQVDTDSLPDYHELDAILRAYVEEDVSAAEIIAAGFSSETVHRVIRMID
ncbi:MAG: NAD+ synthase, partial [Actinomycetales bacterium]|nr:NAD+ synthase [Actinomycetales bacterium]